MASSSLCRNQHRLLKFLAIGFIPITAWITLAVTACRFADWAWRF